jgi:hypothetical protein
MQMRDDTCSINSEIAVGQKKRKKRGRVLYSSRRELQRSRMRLSKHMSRLTVEENLVGVRIDFSGEEVTDLASLQEFVVVEDATQGPSEVVKGNEDLASRSLVRDYPMIRVLKFVISSLDLS